MSLVHLKARQLRDDEYSAEYSIESCDFNEDRKWEEIGIVEIDKSIKQYHFILKGSCSDLRFVPPSLYSLNEAEQEFLLRTKYKDYCCGAWSMTIHHWIDSFIKNNDYPTKHPE